MQLLRKTLTPQMLKMGKLAFLLLFVACVSASAEGFSQQISLAVKNAPLETVLKQFEKKSGMSFLYEKSQLAKSVNVTVDLEKASLEDALKQIFKDQPITYTIQGKLIVLSEKKPLVFQGLDMSGAPPPIDISGKITDKDGNPLNGASVKVKGANKGTTTGIDGVFVLKGVEGSAILEISFIGYEAMTVAVNNKTAIIASLNVATTALQDVVVSKGYYTVKQRLNTGDVSIITAKEIGEQPVTDPIQALIGRVAGLNIQQTSGVPGSYATVTIRGANSIANGNDPLYIVDGVPFSSQSLSSTVFGSVFGSPSGSVSNGTGPQRLGSASGGKGISPFSTLNPSDIENIEVLKDADATAIYGSRGANGVILITTKKGKAGPTKVDISLQQGASQVGHMLDLLNTPQYLAMRREAFKNDGLSFPNIATSPTDQNFDINGVWDTSRYTNWQKTLIGNTAQYSNIQANVSGGNANTQFVIGGGYNRQTTMFPGDYEDKKGSVHANLNHTSSNQKFNLQFTASYGYDNSNLPSTDFTNYIALAPDAPEIYNPDGSLNWAVRNGASTFNNPLAKTLTKGNSVTNYIGSDLNVVYEFLPGLKLSSSFGYSHSEMNQTTISPSAAYPPPLNLISTLRILGLANTTNQTWIIEPKISYLKKVGRGALDVLFGTTFNQNTNYTLANTASGFANDALISNPAAAATYRLGNYNTAEYHYTALYTRIGYNWEEKYLLNITARRDGSSRFGPRNQFGNFGAVGAGWIFSKEKFVSENLSFLSFGKLKVSYGTTGSDQIGNYQYLSSYNVNSPSYQGSTTLSPARIANANYAWETDTKLEVGIDLGFLKDRANLSLNYYQNRTGNQLVGEPLPFISGFGSVLLNLPATVENTGLEINLNTTNIKTAHFRWTSAANLSIPQNKLLSFPGLSTSGYNNTYIIGQSIYLIRLYQFTGINSQTGNYTYATTNTNGTPSFPQDLTVNAILTPKFYGGLYNSFNYKGLQLDFLIRFVKQNGISYLNATSFLQEGAFNYNQPTAVLNRWQNPGDMTNTARFSTYTTSNQPSTGPLTGSSAIITDASFMRLQNISLSYSMPKLWQRWAHLQNATLFLQGQNLLTITNYVGLDPETQSNLTLPPLRTITFGISVSL